MNRFALNSGTPRHCVKSARGLAQSKMLARWNWLAKFAERLGLRRPSAALAVVLASVVLNSRATTNDSFAQGNELSRAGKFPEAAAAFENSERQLPASGALVNLGLAEWQCGHAGAAILAWEQARWIDPFDKLAAQNLNFARTVAQVDAPQLKWFEAGSTWLPPNVWVWLAGISLWLAVGALTLPQFFRWRKAGWQQTLAALAFGFFLFSLAANVGVVSRTQIGIVLKKNAALRLTPTHESEIIATLSAGTPARQLRHRGNYLFIRTVSESGWIEQSEFRRVCAQ